MFGPKPVSARDYAACSDDDLMGLARQGETAAFEALVARHQQSLLRTAAKWVGPHDAADAAQNAFVDLYRYRERYRPQGKLRPLLYRMLLNQCRMARRRQRPTPLGVVEPPEPKDPLAPSREGADDELLRRERREQVERALATLSPKLRVVVELRYAAGLSLEEIAETLEIAVGTVKSRLFAGLEKMRRAFEP